MSKSEIEAAEKLLLDWLRSSDQPVSPIDLLSRPRPDDVSPLGIRNAMWNLVDSGAARVTRDECLEPVR
ncbi:MAG TPA: hypothetical protein VEX86_28060 [Longimicrobium sp.]|nr:hypothetical protein [Longimicrobium sp.]